MMMTRRLPVLLLILLAGGLLYPTQSHGQLLYSWEGDLEGWSAESGFSISNTGGSVGVTDGIDSLAATIPDQGFQRWGSVNLAGQQLTDMTTAAANPLTRRIEFDVTFDTSSIPQGRSPSSTRNSP